MTIMFNFRYLPNKFWLGIWIFHCVFKFAWLGIWWLEIYRIMTQHIWGLCAYVDKMSHDEVAIFALFSNTCMICQNRIPYIEWYQVRQVLIYARTRKQPDDSPLLGRVHVVCGFTHWDLRHLSNFQMSIYRAFPWIINSISEKAVVGRDSGSRRRQTLGLSTTYRQRLNTQIIWYGQ